MKKMKKNVVRFKNQVFLGITLFILLTGMSSSVLADTNTTTVQNLSNSPAEYCPNPGNVLDCSCGQKSTIPVGEAITITTPDIDFGCTDEDAVKFISICEGTRAIAYFRSHMRRTVTPLCFTYQLTPGTDAGNANESNNISVEVKQNNLAAITNYTPTTN